LCPDFRTLVLEPADINSFPTHNRSYNIPSMTKPRRKSDIRAAALAEVAALREAARMRAAFLQPGPVSWHDIFLQALRDGQGVTAAARAAGITKSGAYFARAHRPGFALRWQKAVAEAQAARWAARGINPLFGSTTNCHGST
jgi:hypothetical protein